MSDTVIYSIGALFICFTIATYLLNNIKTGIIPEDYEFQYDPFWYIISVLLFGSCTAFYFFPQHFDCIKDYNILDFALPPIFAAIIYFISLLGFSFLTNLFILIFGGIIVYNLPADFILIPSYFDFWTNKFILLLILFFITTAFPILNGLGGLASSQFVAVMVATFILSFLGYLPAILSVIAAVYASVMLAFLVFSWPPEKLVLSNGAFSALGFILGCFVLYNAIEFADSSMLVALSLLIVETFSALHNRYICNNKTEFLFMNTSYYRLSSDGDYEEIVVRAYLKLLAVNILLAIVQIVSKSALAFPCFAIAINFWLISIFSGKTKPVVFFSFTKWGTSSISTLIKKKKKSK